MKLIYALIFFPVLIYAQDMRQNSMYSLFSDQKAAREGDAVTVIVIESSQASNNQETTTGRNSSLGINAEGELNGKALPGAEIGIGSNNKFNGSGSTKTSGNIRTKISATVDSVLSNGNLYITGNKKLIINGEEQTISIKGIIRTSDINSDNSVLSSNISEAEIQFDGSGMINESQKPGWLTRLFHWIF